MDILESYKPLPSSQAWIVRLCCMWVAVLAWLLRLTQLRA